MTEQCEPVPETGKESQKRIKGDGEPKIQQGSVPSDASENQEALKQEKAPALLQ